MLLLLLLLLLHPWLAPHPDGTPTHTTSSSS
jgi:hypothetical protein